MNKLILSTSLVISLSTAMAAEALPELKELTGFSPIGDQSRFSLSTSPDEMASVEIRHELRDFVTRIESNGQITLTLTAAQYHQFKELIDGNERFTVTITPLSAHPMLVIPHESLPTSPLRQNTPRFSLLQTTHIDPTTAVSDVVPGHPVRK